MDFSDYNVEHPNYDKSNKKVLGKFKDEMNGKITTMFIGLKPKAYCYKVYGEDREQKKGKGVVKHKASNKLNYITYEDTLNRLLKEEVQFNTIRFTFIYFLRSLLIVIFDEQSFPILAHLERAYFQVLWNWHSF